VHLTNNFIVQAVNGEVHQMLNLYEIGKKGSAWTHEGLKVIKISSLGELMAIFLALSLDGQPSLNFTLTLSIIYIYIYIYI
jgi:hypothetical protein